MSPWRQHVYSVVTSSIIEQTKHVCLVHASCLWLKYMYHVHKYFTSGACISKANLSCKCACQCLTKLSCNLFLNIRATVCDAVKLIQMRGHLSHHQAICRHGIFFSFKVYGCGSHPNSFQWNWLCRQKSPWPFKPIIQTKKKKVFDGHMHVCMLAACFCVHNLFVWIWIPNRAETEEHIFHHGITHRTRNDNLHFTTVSLNCGDCGSHVVVDSHSME